MLQPSHLQKGDAVTIVSTARKITKSELQNFVNFLENWELEVNFASNLFAEDRQFAGTKEQRLSDLQTALDDQNCKAVFCSRGGYGTAQLIDSLDFTKFKEKPKWIVGYSDVTVLHSHINQNFGIETLHATMSLNLKPDTDQDNMESLRKALFNENYSIDFQVEKESILNKNDLTAPIVGGNLSILYSLSGSNSQLNTEGKFLFMEDLDEYLYHIDRMIINLKRSCLFEGCLGILVGGMSDMNDNKVPYGRTAKEIILENTKSLGIPVIFGVPAGHIDKNFCLILNRNATLNIKNEQAKLTFHGRT